MYGILNHPHEGEYDIAGPHLRLIGNLICDDWLNKVECNYDAGDCCGPFDLCHTTKGTIFGTKYCKDSGNRN